jgi:thioesterase domain-containing protein
MRSAEQAKRVERYLHEVIPLCASMQVKVVLATPEQVRLSAPLAPNVNHHETVFGGSAVALATLAAWTLVHTRLQSIGCDAQLVIQRSAMEYTRPICGDFAAVCAFDDRVAWQRFDTILQRRGRARVTMISHLVHRELQVASFQGDFVALRRDP